MKASESILPELITGGTTSNPSPNNTEITPGGKLLCIASSIGARSDTPLFCWLVNDRISNQESWKHRSDALVQGIVRRPHAEGNTPGSGRR